MGLLLSTPNGGFYDGIYLKVDLEGVGKDFERKVEELAYLVGKRTEELIERTDKAEEKSEDAKKTADSVRKDADDGKFDGKDGDKGPKGDKGKDGKPYAFKGVYYTFHC